MHPTLRWQLHRVKWWAQFPLYHGVAYSKGKISSLAFFQGLGPFHVDATEPLEVHILTSKKDLILAIWALASWYEIGRRSDLLCIHDDGTLSLDNCRLLAKTFPGCRVVSIEESDAIAFDALRSYPHLRSYRKMHPTARKLLDFALCRRRPDIVLLDSDVFTFAPLNGLTFWITSSGNIFMRDYQYAFSIDRGAFQRLSSAPYCPINTGFGVVRQSTFDWDRGEYILRMIPDIYRLLHWTEQTMYALLSTSGILLLDNQAFSVARGPGLSGVVMKHYVSLVRPLAFAEAIPAIVPQLAYGHTRHRWLR